MALTSIIAKVNLVTNKLELQFVNATPAITAGSVRVLAPDGQYYYGLGNSANFVSGTGLLTVSVSSTSAFLVAMDLPLDVNGLVQIGTYKVDCNYTAGSVLSYSGVLSTTGFSYVLCTTPIVSLGVVVNCDIPNATFSDNTNYIINNTTPTITSSNTLTKTNNTPAFTSIPFSTQSYPLAGTFYAGNYTLAISTTLSYQFVNYIVSMVVTGSNNALIVQCSQDECTIACAYSTLNTNLQNASIKSTNYNTYLQKSTLLSFYDSAYRSQKRCKNVEGANLFMAQIQALVGMNSGCCGNDNNYQIKSTSLCDCRQPVQIPSLSTSNTDGSGTAYVVGDVAYDSNYEYRYVAPSTWTRNVHSTY